MNNDNIEIGSKHSISISIPVSLFNRIKVFIGNTQFSSVSEYATYALREFLIKQEEETRSEAFNDEEIEHIKEKLRALGYID